MIVGFAATCSASGYPKNRRLRLQLPARALNAYMIEPQSSGNSTDGNGYFKTEAKVQMKDWSHEQQAARLRSESAAPEVGPDGGVRPSFSQGMSLPGPGPRFVMLVFPGFENRACDEIITFLGRGADIRYRRALSRPTFRVADRSDPFLQGPGLRPAETVPKPVSGFFTRTCR